MRETQLYCISTPGSSLWRLYCMKLFPRSSLSRRITKVSLRTSLDYHKTHLGELKLKAASFISGRLSSMRHGWLVEIWNRVNIESIHFSPISWNLALHEYPTF